MTPGAIELLRMTRHLILSRGDESNMELAMIGLGRMGGNMARRLIKGGHRVVAYNRSPDPIKELEKEGAVGAYSLKEVVDQLKAPRVVWIMVPAGKPTDDMIDKLMGLLATGDTIIDGGNSNFR